MCKRCVIFMKVDTEGGLLVFIPSLQNCLGKISWLRNDIILIKPSVIKVIQNYSRVIYFDVFDKQKYNM